MSAEAITEYVEAYQQQLARLVGLQKDIQNINNPYHSILKKMFNNEFTFVKDIVTILTSIQEKELPHFENEKHFRGWVNKQLQGVKPTWKYRLAFEESHIIQRHVFALLQRNIPKNVLDDPTILEIDDVGTAQAFQTLSKAQGVPRAIQKVIQGELAVYKRVSGGQEFVEARDIYGGAKALHKQCTAYARLDRQPYLIYKIRQRIDIIESIIDTGASIPNSKTIRYLESQSDFYDKMIQIIGEQPAPNSENGKIDDELAKLLKQQKEYDTWIYETAITILTADERPDRPAVPDRRLLREIRNQLTNNGVTGFNDRKKLYKTRKRELGILGELEFMFGLGQYKEDGIRMLYEIIKSMISITSKLRRIVGKVDSKSIYKRILYYNRLVAGTRLQDIPELNKKLEEYADKIEDMKETMRHRRRTVIKAAVGTAAAAGIGIAAVKGINNLVNNVQNMPSIGNRRIKKHIQWGKRNITVTVERMQSVYQGRVQAYRGKKVIEILNSIITEEMDGNYSPLNYNTLRAFAIGIITAESTGRGSAWAAENGGSIANSGEASGIMQLFWPTFRAVMKNISKSNMNDDVHNIRAGIRVIKEELALLNQLQPSAFRTTERWVRLLSAGYNKGGPRMKDICNDLGNNYSEDDFQLAVWKTLQKWDELYSDPRQRFREVLLHGLHTLGAYQSIP